MDKSTWLTLKALPSLDPDRVNATARHCKICKDQAIIFDITDFWKSDLGFRFGLSGISIPYFRCPSCGFMFTDFCDDWTKLDFSRFIYNDEYLKVDPNYENLRPQKLAEQMSKSLKDFKDCRILDYGSGSGRFATYMNECGFHLESYDPYSSPIRPSGKFDIITCFEVIEHSADPLKTLEDIVSFLDTDGLILLGEALQPLNIEEVRCNWWYCMPRNGHISLFTDTSLALAAAQFGMLFHPGISLHTFSRKGGSNFRGLAARTAPALLPITLGAPSFEKKECWHGTEQLGGSKARWTARKSITWTVDLPPVSPTKIRLRIPFHMEIRPGFAADSTVTIDGTRSDINVLGRCIVAEAVLSRSGSIEVALETPDPISPSQLRGSTDKRLLGLAIPYIA